MCVCGGGGGWNVPTLALNAPRRGVVGPVYIFISKISIPHNHNLQTRSQMLWQNDPILSNSLIFDEQNIDIAYQVHNRNLHIRFSTYTKFGVKQNEIRTFHKMYEQ